MCECVCVISLEISAYLQFDGGKRVCLEYRVNMMWQINGCWIMRHGILINVAALVFKGIMIMLYQLSVAICIM